MSKINLSNKQMERVRQIGTRESDKYKRWFLKKKFNHYHNPRIIKFWGLFEDKVSYSEKLYEVRMRSSFAFYLYLYLKSLAKGYDEGTDFTVSAPIEVNFERIQKLSGVVKNTVKQAFWELVRVGLLLYTGKVKPRRHSTTKLVMVLNDKYLVGFDDATGKIVYSLNPSNYNNG